MPLTKEEDLKAERSLLHSEVSLRIENDDYDDRTKKAYIFMRNL
jgi:hypothetical protein